MPDGRFAPSPSGPLHVGNLRTALLGWLCARGGSGRHLVRIEDLDPASSRDEHVRSHLADLADLGIDWDGEVVRQSERRERHAEVVDRLVDDGLVYPCYCSRSEVADAAAAPHEHLPDGAYPGTCATLDRAGRARREQGGRVPAWRVRAEGAVVEFVDRLAGRRTGAVDDFVVRRRDGVVSYNVAVVVDDHDQGIDEVVRGDDLLAGTPRHAWLADLLGQPRPSWVHVPLVLGPDGRRLAKRHGDITLDRVASRWEVSREDAAVRLRVVLARSIGLEVADGAAMDDLLEAWSQLGGVAAAPSEPWIFDT